MGVVLPFTFTPKQDRKARFRARRERLGLAVPRTADDLAMDHADPEYAAPVVDPA